MTLIRSLVESRAITAQNFAKGIILDGHRTDSGVNVSPTSALTQTVVWASVRLLSESVAMLPVAPFKGEGKDRLELPRPGWMVNPTPEHTRMEWVQANMTGLLLRGNSFNIVMYDRRGEPAELWPVDQESLNGPYRDSKNRVYWEDTDGNKYRRFNAATRDGELLHFRGLTLPGEVMGLSPIEQAKQAIGLGLVTEKFGASFFGRGQTVSGVIEVPGNIEPEFADSVRQYWVKTHGGVDRSHYPAILSGGAKFNTISIPPEQAQFLETRSFQVSEIARIFGVPPHMVGDVEKTTSWGTGIEQQSIGFVVYSLQPWLVRMEQTMNGMLPRGQFVKWNVNGLLRGDIKSRFEAYSIGRQNGWLSANEIRELEDLVPVRKKGMDGYLQPLNMQEVGAKPEPAPAPTEEAPQE